MDHKGCPPESATEAQRVSTIPSVLSSTTPPKFTLSYRWVINNVKCFLEGRSRGEGFRSPAFSATQTEPKKTTWRLLLKTGTETRYHYVHSEYSESYQYTAYTISLCCGPLQSQSTEVLKLWISECTSSIINHETNKVMFNNTIRERLMPATLSLYVAENLSKYFCNDTLTIQVDATLLCYSDPIETAEVIEVRKVPQDNLRVKLYNSYKNEAFTDVTIKCGDKEFNVHKIILASQSPVFEKMFEINMKEKRSNIVEISDIDPSIMSELLAYLYVGTAPNLSTLAKELLNAADKYEISRLLEMCENELQSTLEVTNVVENLLLADLHSTAYLRRACWSFIHLNSVEVCKTSQWKSFKENLDKYPTLLVEMMEFVGMILKHE